MLNKFGRPFCLPDFSKKNERRGLAMKKEYVKAQVEEIAVSAAMGYLFEEYIEKFSKEVDPDAEDVYELD